MKIHHIGIHLRTVLMAVLPLFLALPASADTWLFYWYLVGSNLESEGGAASADLQELLNAKLSKDVKVYIQTGGAKEWANRQVKASKSQRFLVDSDGLHEIYSGRAVDMGATESFRDFIEFGKKNFRADHRVLIFWDHGSGPTGGVGYDEQHNFNFLSFNKINKALTDVYGGPKKVFDIIGFDACLMSSVDSLFFTSLWGDYMVASQELEPGNGWEYTGFMSDLSRNTSMSPRKLGELIVDSYHRGCEEAGSEEAATLALTDARHSAAFLGSLQELGGSMIMDLTEAETQDELVSSLTRIDRKADSAERFGDSSDSSEVIDVGQFISSLCSGGGHQEECSAVRKAYSDVVLYNKTGDASEGTGLSLYYPVSKDEEKFGAVLENGYFPSPFMVIAGILTGSIDDEMIDAIMNETYKLNEYYSNAALAGGGEAESSGSSSGGNGGASEPSGGNEQAEAGASSGNGSGGAGGGSFFSALDNGSSSGGSGSSGQKGGNGSAGTGGGSFFSSVGSGAAETGGSSGTAGGSEGGGTQAHAGSSGASGGSFSLDSMLTDVLNSIQTPGGSVAASFTNVAQSVVAQAAAMHSINTTVQKDEGVSKLEDLDVSLRDDGTSYIEIPKQYLSSVSRVTYIEGILVEEDKKEGTPPFVIFIGEGGKLDADWDKGVFSDQVYGSWPAIDGNLLPLEANNVTDRYITYDCHVKINKKDSSMNIVYEKKTQKYRILGFTPWDDTDTSMAQRKITKLKKGDVITPVFEAVTTPEDGSEDKDFEFEGDSFKYSESMEIKDEDVGDVELMMYYQISDFKGNQAASKFVYFTVKGDNIEVELDDDEEDGESDSEDGGSGSGLQKGTAAAPYTVTGRKIGE